MGGITISNYTLTPLFHGHVSTEILGSEIYSFLYYTPLRKILQLKMLPNLKPKGEHFNLQKNI